MNRLLYTAPLATLASIGVAINSAYYFHSFIHSGYGPNYAVALAVAFMFLEVALWLYSSYRQWYLAILKFAIVFYSIFITLSGQYFSTSIAETTARKAISNTTGYEEEIQDYREQIEALNGQIDKYIDQNRLFGSERNRADRERAETKRDELQQRLYNARDMLRSEEAIIEPPKTAYDLFAGWTKIDTDTIRFVFQLFASTLLALLAPISLTMIRRGRDVPEPEPIQPVEPPSFGTFNPGLPDHDKATILKMLLWYVEHSNGDLMLPEQAEKEFKRLHEEKETVKKYSLDDCRAVYDEIISRGLEGETAEIIRSEVLR